jgi:muconolactone delta-isomerase
VEFLVTMTTQVPDGTTEAAVHEMRSREAIRAAELAEQGALRRLWRPPLQPGEWRSYGLFAAGDDTELENVLSSMPLRVWRSDAVTALAVHPNDPAGRPGTVAAAPGSEYFTWFKLAIPADADAGSISDARAGEARRTRELAEEGRLLRLWVLPGDGLALGLWSATDDDMLKADLASLPLIDWLDIELTRLTPHPSDPAQP